MRYASHHRLGRARSLLVLVTVLLLAAVGVAYGTGPAMAISVVTGSITIVKGASGPGEGTAQFDFTTTNLTPGTFTLGDGDSQPFADLPAASGYAIAEDGEPGWNLNSIICTYSSPDTSVQALTDTGTLIGVTIGLAEGDDVTCTFYNESDLSAGSLTVVKDADPADDTEFDFTVALNGGVPGDLTLADPSHRGDTITGPGAYTVTELGPPTGWVFDDVTCTGAAVWSHDGPALSVTVGAEETVVCTFYNSRNTGTLRVHKVISGGSATCTDFRVKLGDGSFVPFEVHDSDCYVDFTDLVTGAAPTVVEEAEEGYSITANTCSNLQITEDQTTECSITNTRDTGSIILVKELFDPAGLWDDDGSPTFTLQLGGSDYVLPIGGTDWDTDPIVLPTTLAGESGYSVTEPSPPANWIVQDITCVNAAGEYPDPAAIVLDKGETVTCTVTNERLPSGSLTVVKEADPANDTPFSFTGSLATPGVVAGATSRAAYVLEPFVLRDPSDDYRTFENQGEFSVTEGALGAGWEFDGVSCTGAAEWSADGPTVDVTVGRDETVVCTFFNSGYGEIIVEKVVPTVDAPAATFEFDASFGDFSLSDGGSHSSGLLPAGVYSVAELLSAEQVAAGWQLGSAFCSDGSGLGGIIGVSVGETVTCTFENVYQAPPGYLRVVKAVDGGSAVCGDFSFSVDGGTAAPFEADCDNLFEFPAGSHHSVVEEPATGYAASYSNCTDVEIVAGETTVCTITNTYEEEGPGGSLTIIKVTDPAGGEGYQFDAGPLGTFTLDDGGSRLFGSLEAGAYTVTELDAELLFTDVDCDAVDWTSDGASVTVNLADGEAAVCTFYNSGESEGPDLPYTGSGPFTLPLLLSSLTALLAGLALWVWSLIREADNRR